MLFCVPLKNKLVFCLVAWNRTDALLTYNYSIVLLSCQIACITASFHTVLVNCILLMMKIEQCQICSYLSKAIAQPGSITQASY